MSEKWAEQEPMACFWKQCSNHKRCRDHGSCVAASQVGGKDIDRRECAAKILDRRYPKVAEKIRAGMRSSTWPEDLIDPGLLLDILEAAE